MESEADPNVQLLYARARRAYERGRLLSGCVRAAVLSAAVGWLGAELLHRSVWVWLPLSSLLWIGLYYRGGALWRGTRHGLVAGLVTWLLPLSVLRPCCKPGAMRAAGDMASTCTMPEMCVLAGAVLGLGLAATMPRRLAGKRITFSLGMLLGVTSLAALKCSALFAGEALGLLGGLSAGVIGLSALEAVLDQRRALG